MLPRLKTALDIKNAIEDVGKLDLLGVDVSALQSYYSRYGDYGMEPDESSEWPLERLAKFKAIASELTTLRKGYTADFQSGYCRHYHKLCITRPGCEFDGKLERLDDHLQAWFEKSDVSGYGNVQTQETIVDESVRNAREIPASEFSVSENLLREIENIWSKSFIPSQVRAEPYKIHLYGPGGHFRSHKDTPEKGLVGTFLVGLGDTTQPEARFKIGENTYSAYAAQYVAFYPDVPHEVLKIDEGYRAVIAFKLFRAEQQTENLPDRYSEVISRLDAALNKLERPFGIYLTHQYEKSMIDPSGFDKLLVEAVRKLPDMSVHIIPVLMISNASIDEQEAECNYAWTSVYPITDSHLNYLLGDKDALTNDSTITWMKGVDKIPFVQIKGAHLTEWSYERNEGPGYTGNESRAHDEHAVYLSYAVIALPNSPLDAFENLAISNEDKESGSTED